jgi:hypothetical protein
MIVLGFCLFFVGLSDDPPKQVHEQRQALFSDCDWQRLLIGVDSA